MKQELLESFSLEISQTRYQVKKKSTHFSQLDFTSVIELWHLPMSGSLPALSTASVCSEELRLN